MTITAIQPSDIVLRPRTVSVRDQEAGWWVIIRSAIAVAAVLVWILFIVLPGMEAITNLDQMALHFPQVVTGLGLLGGIMAAYSLRADGHFIWFTTTLLLLAGWMW
ncbi:MAG: hypothetical protein RLZZ422_398 [Pseudomonadota bacterium]|jgi:hypothetical protein